VRDQEIQVLRHWLGEYAHETISMRFVADERVRIRSGVLMDAEAKVVVQKGNKLKLFLEGLRAEVTVDLQQNQVDKIDASKPH
jgi:transcription antitermination factor NusG